MDYHNKNSFCLEISLMRTILSVCPAVAFRVLLLFLLLLHLLP